MLKDLGPGWKIEDGWLKNSLELENFQAVIDLVNKISEFAEEMNHHPELRIHSYKKLEISIQTHEAGGLTKKDFELAEKIEKLLE